MKLRLKVTAWLLQGERQRSERFGHLLSLTEKLSATVHVRSVWLNQPIFYVVRPQLKNIHQRLIAEG